MYFVPWVPEVFLARGGNFRCRPKADTASAVEPETALEESLAPRVCPLGRPMGKAVEEVVPKVSKFHVIYEAQSVITRSDNEKKDEHDAQRSIFDEL